MIRAAGILYIANGQALFLQRALGGDHAGEWCLPGGKIEEGETPEQAARREFFEETGHEVTGELVLWSRRKASDATPIPAPPPDSPIGMVTPAPALEVDYTTFIVRTDEQFEPKPNTEHTGFAWALPSAPPEPLHPGCRVALAKLAMDELGVARAIAAGDLTSPQRYENVSLFALRITGTGTSYRRKHDEFVYRRPENYLSPEFLARCNGLPVIFQHPKKSTLDSEEFADRIIGTILLPYIFGDEVWGIAKIYDDAAIEMMATQQLSTSPAVFFRDQTVNSKMTLEDGSTLLIEGKPSLLDHLAICERGVWDKGEEPSGVRADATSQNGDHTMPTPEEIKAKADAEAAEEAKKKADADTGTKLDKLLSGLDSLNSRMDSFEAKEKAKADADEKAKADADAKAKADAEEAEKKKGDPEQTAADKAKKDAEEAEAKKKADEEEAEKKKADAQTNDLAKRIDAVQAMIPKRLSDADHAAMADCQARADSVFQGFGERAPRPLDGETTEGYRRRLATKLKPHSPLWKDVDIAAIADSATFQNIESQVYADADVAARHPVDVPDGVLREIVRQDPSTGTRTINFVGKGTFIGGLKRPARVITGIGIARAS